MRTPPTQIPQQNLFNVEEYTAKPEQRGKSENSYVFDIVDALSAPILTFSQQWADTIPQRILNQVTLARLVALKQGELLATYIECVAYLYTRTMEAPMNSDWVDIYTHVSCKTLEEWFGEDHWKDIGAPRELSEWLCSKLNDLRHHIYDKRREILKTKIKEQERSENGDPEKRRKDREENLPPPPTQQRSLF